MSERLIFDYYYGKEAEQFAFYRIPRMLVKDERFSGLSNDAKLLYGLMLDRMSLSVKNGWQDDMDRTYIIYTMEQIMEDLNCGKDKAVSVVAELDCRKGIGLIEKKRIGLGRPDIIYVKNFIGAEGVDDEEKEDCPEAETSRTALEDVDGESHDCAEVGKTGKQISEKPKSEKPENRVLEVGMAENQKSEKPKSGSRKKRRLETGKTEDQKSEKPRTGSRKNRRPEIGRTEIQKPEEPKTRNRKSRIPEFGNPDANYNNHIHTDNSQNNMSQTDPINPVHQTGQIGTAGEEGKKKQVMIDSVRLLIQNNVGYPILIHDHPTEQKQIEELIEIMVEACVSSKQLLRIGGEDKLQVLVQSRFEKYDHSMMEYVLRSLDQNTTKVRNIKNYLLTTLYNAPLTMENYYRAEVNHDLYGEE